jgi:hypothetical protein
VGPPDAHTAGPKRYALSDYTGLGQSRQDVDGENTSAALPGSTEEQSFGRDAETVASITLPWGLPRSDGGGKSSKVATHGFAESVPAHPSG